jgi:hypothetical protein
MNQTQVEVQGTLQVDGTLVLDEKPALPPGRVRVVVQAMVQLPQDDPFWQRMQAMWDTQKAHGQIPRSVEEVESERRSVREEWEERMQAIARIQRGGQETSKTED